MNKPKRKLLRGNVPLEKQPTVDKLEEEDTTERFEKAVLAKGGGSFGFARFPKKFYEPGS